MPSSQWKTGLINVTNASQIIIGTASCDWVNQLSVGHTVKVDLDNESTYVIGEIITATRMIISSNYTGTTGTGLSYMANRSFTSTYGFFRPLQGDADWAEILSQDTIDPIDTELAAIDARLEDVELDAIAADITVINASIDALQTNMINANASIDALQTNMVNANASIGIWNTNLTVANSSIDALQANMVNANASIDALQTNTVNANASITVNRTNITRANASIDALQLNIIDANASIDALQTNMINANASIAALDVNAINASIDSLQTNVINANASIDALQTNMVNANASIGVNITNITRTNASIAPLQTNVINANASIGVNITSITRANASIDALQTNMTNANASIDALQTNTVNANASIDALQTNVTNINASIAYYKEEFVPIEWGKNCASYPADAEDINQSYQTVVVRNFDGSKYEEKLSFILRAPDGIQGTTIQYNPYVVVTNATFFSTKGVVFGMKGHGRDYAGASYGSEVLASLININASRYEVFDIGWSSAVTLASLTGGKLAFLEFARKYSNADDDYTDDVGVPGIGIRWI